MKIHYTSDTHLDFWISEHSLSVKLDNKILDYANKFGLNGDADVLILAGDLGHYFVQDSQFLLLMKSLYKDVILVYGNHDFYLVSNSTRKKYNTNSMNRISEMKEFCAMNGIHYLDGETVRINGISFGGVGMSWDKSYIEMLRKEKVSDETIRNKFIEYMNDSKLIMFGKRPVTIDLGYYTKEYINIFNQKEFYLKEVNKLRNIGLSESIDVMITHYGPCVSSDIKSEYKNSEITTFFYFNGTSEILRIKPQYWIHGHTHNDISFKFDQTDVRCNPIGYPHENKTTKVGTIFL